MPLSEYEQRVLAQMERQLSSDDPKLAQTFSDTPRVRRTSRVVLGVAVVAVGLAVLVVGLVESLSWLGILGFVVMFGGVMLALSRAAAPGSQAAPGATGSGPAGAKASPKPRSSFMSRLDDRWDKRRDQRG